MRSVSVKVFDFIDIALIIQKKNDDELMDFFLDLIGDQKLTFEDFGEYESKSMLQFVGDDLMKLELTLRDRNMFSEEGAM